MARRFGYSRVSTSDQDWSLQLEALTKAGVDDRDIFREKASGAKRDRTELRRMLDQLRPGLKGAASHERQRACYAT
jgi:DNA invertase Pin-like site-specific DNA recombinase